MAVDWRSESHVREEGRRGKIRFGSFHSTVYNLGDQAKRGKKAVFYTTPSVPSFIYIPFLSTYNP